MVEFSVEENVPPILVELVPRPGVRQISLSALSREDMAIESKEAMDNAVKVIQGMALRISSAVDDIEVSQRPSGIEVDFGIKLDTEGGALISKSDDEASIKVKLILAR